MQLLVVLWAAGVATAALTHIAHSPGGAQEFRSQGPDGYTFGYSHAHGSDGGASWRKESADAAGNVVGSYGLKDADGRVRLVTYTANGNGFQANVQSNEPGLPQYPGLEAGITQWPVAPPGQIHGHQPGGFAGIPGSAPHQGPWAGGSPHGSPGRGDGPGGRPYTFSYDSRGVGGPFHQETGDVQGNKRGVYGLPGRTVNYEADARGFRASVQSNELGVDASQNPADVVFTGSPSAGPAPSPPPPPPPSGGHEDGNNGLVFPPPYPGSAGSTGSGRGTVSTGYGSQDGSGAYDFAYGQDMGPFQKESGDAAGNKKGVYGLKDLDGRTRTVTYEADDGGFRATVHSNEPGVDDTQDPADVHVSKAPEPAGIALVYSGPPGSAPAGARLVPPHGSGVPAAGDGGVPLGPGAAGGINTGFGQQDGSGAYNFAYGGDQAVGPWQRESGDAAGNKAGSYGLKDNDGRFRTVNYVAGNEGFRATVDTNEPGVDGAQSPADVAVNKSPEPAGVVPVVGSTGIPDAAGVVHGQPPVIARGGILGVQGPSILPASPVGPAVAGLPAASPFPGTVGLGGVHGFSAGSSNPTLIGPAPPAGVAFNVPSLGPVGGYRFGYIGGPGGAFHRETGGPSGVKSGVFGFSGDGGTVRTVNYVADAGGFRASVQSNEPGVDISQNPAGVLFGAPGTAVGPPAALVPSGPHQHQAGHANARWPPTQVLPPSASGAQVPWSSGSFGPSFSHNHGPGSFYYKTQVLGPQNSISEVHRY